MFMVDADPELIMETNLAFYLGLAGSLIIILP